MSLAHSTVASVRSMLSPVVAIVSNEACRDRISAMVGLNYGAMIKPIL